MKPPVGLLIAAALLAGCEREKRPFDGSGYLESAWNVNEGMELYGALNCGGCHAKGGGDLGPAFMRAHWRYGNDPRSVLTSILDGRPRGMPAYRGKVTESDAQKLAAYVRSLGGLVRTDAMSARDEHMSSTPAPPLDHVAVPFPARSSP